MCHSTTKRECVSAIVPARNEEAVIEACIRSLAAQQEIAEVLVIDDQSVDRTAEILRGLTAEFPKVRLLVATELPAGWVGKNNAVWIGANEARSEWLLFADADAVHEVKSAAKALEIAEQQNAALVSFSPEQVMKTWYEKAVIPYIFTRLASRFRFEEVNDPKSPVAAANGQFLLVRRDAYEAVGGHARVAGEVLEDVALAKQLKQAGYRIWFGSGKGSVRVRMYRSFVAMWEGWTKNLYSLMGGTPQAMKAEMRHALLPFALILLTLLGGWVMTKSAVFAWVLFATGLFWILLGYGLEIRWNGFPLRLTGYGLAGRVLFAGVLWASYRSYRDGQVEWKGRAYPANPRRI